MSSSDAIYPRITFRAPGKTFDRLLKESSLSSLKDAVRKKLGLGAGSMIQFAQLRHEQVIDLEDEDDFDAFCAVVREQHHANVQVVVFEKSIDNDSKDGNPPVSGSNPSSQLSNSSTSTETSSPATCPSPLPSRTSTNQPSQHPPPSSQPSFTPFVPNTRPQPLHQQQQNTGPNSGPPPRSPYPRQLNGAGPRPQQGPNASPSQVPPAMSSPRLGAHPPAMPPPPPQMGPQMQPQVPWPGYYYPNPEHQCYIQYQCWNWATPQMPPATPHPHQHPPHHPPPGPHTSGVPMSPRTHPPPMQGPPTLSHALPAPVSHPPPPISHAPSNSMSSMSSPPPTPVSALLGIEPSNVNSTTSDSGAAAPRKKVVLRNEDAIETNAEVLTTKASPIPLTMPMATRHNPSPTLLTKKVLIRIETPEQRQKRLQEERKETAAEDNVEERGKKREEKRKENKKQEQEINAQTLTVDDIAETDRENKEDESTEILGELHPSKKDNEEWSREALEINMSLLKQKRHEHLKSQNSQLPPSRLSLVRLIEDINTITYPEGINDPKPELNIGSRGGKFRYDRDFLLQFMSVCKEKPAFLFPLDAFGLEPVHPLSSIHVPGNFSVSVSSANIPLPPLQKTENQSVELIPSRRTRTKRRERSKASNTSANSLEAQSPDLGFITPFPATGDRWDRKPITNNDPDSPEVIDSEVRILLDKLVVEDFDTTSNEIIRWANRSENCKDGRILVQIAHLVFEKATDEATWSEMYARLCRKMVDQISPKVQDEGIKNFDGNPITGGQLFRKYLLNRCQEDFERGWFAKEATAAAAATKAAEDQAIKVANDQSDSGEVILYSDEYYAAQKAKRQGLGLIKFMGELFKLQMLTERIMHECIKKLLGNVQNPEEEEIESLCTLLTTVGSLLDTVQARAHLDVYFQRMQELSKNVSPRMQFMLQDVIELRDRKWQARNTDAPSTIAQVHEAASKKKLTRRKKPRHNV